MRYPNAIDLDAVPAKAPTEVGHTIWHFAALPSTTDTLMALIEGGYGESGTVVVAGEQSRGHGRLGRSWHASSGSGLLLSVYLSPVLPRLTYCMGALAVRGAIEEATGLAVSIKWPNDLLLTGKKVCGILINGLNQAAVIGIGINSNMQPVELDRIGPDVTSLRVALGRCVDHTHLLACLLDNLEDQYQRSRTSPEDVFQEWRRALVTLGQNVEVETAQGRWVGRAVDVAEDGSLLVTNDNRLERVYAADVRLRSI